jgi:osmoprotectant transport system ATP-binding protein
MIELRGVRKSFGATVALERTDLAFPPGATTALIGPSGCGKSTLLRLLLGLVAPSEGDVFFDGEPLAPGNLAAVRHRIGYVVQDGGLFPHLTARENVVLLARYLKTPEERRRRRLRELSELVKLPDAALDRYPGELSGGQCQRVALMRALLLEPAALLLDEPLAALDPLVRSSLQEDLREIFLRLGATTVFVTHDMAEAAYLADHIVLMREGRIVQRGTAADLRDSPAEPFVSSFLRAQKRVAF